MRVKETVNSLIEQAIQKHASDIFFLIQNQELIINLRTIAGIKRQRSFSVNEGREVINFLKFAAQMDIAEHRRPQVGALEYQFNHEKYYLRLSSIGDYNDNESLVIRIIYRIGASKFFYSKQLQRLEKLTQKRGLILTSGPTSSGKTTTMYKLAKRMSKSQMVMTIEDPVEIQEKSFLQTQVNFEAGITYTKLLEAAMRHRPDILIIGEIRNSATAQLAVDAALSGHLVFATVHAKSTLQTLSRLESLHVNANELSNCLTAICYQRLLPTVNGSSCLMDIAAEDDLTNALSQSIRSDFINWPSNLTKLCEGGQISAQVYERFKKG